METTNKNFTVIPALDVYKDGMVVRLKKGDFEDTKTEYQYTAIQKITEYLEQGATRIHTIDLAGAEGGRPVNVELFRSIGQLIKDFEKKSGKEIIWQVGGGIRNAEDVSRVFNDYGAEKVILGGAAIERELEDGYISKLVKEYGVGRFIVDIAVGQSLADADKKSLKKNGWKEDVSISLEDALSLFKKIGVTEALVTGKDNDGMEKGPDIDLAVRVRSFGFNVILSGGVSSVADCLNAKNAGLTSAVIGRALCDGKLRYDEVASRLDLRNFDELRFDLRNSKGRTLNAGSTLKKRIIPCLDLKNGRIVKGTNFTDLLDAGDPVAVAKKYCEEGADEIVILDIASSAESREDFLKLVEDIAAVMTVPLAVGGGIKTVADIRDRLSRGADKVSIGSAAVTNPEIVSEASNEFGAQCIVISVDPRWNGSFWEIYIKGGKEATGINAVDFAIDMERRGAGELLVNSIDRDGTKSGYDIPLLKAIAEKVRIPIIASSGAGKIEDFLELFKETTIDAGLAASIFHFKDITIPNLKSYLRTNNIAVRYDNQNY